MISGVSRGLGAALAQGLLEKGYEVLGIGRAVPSEECELLEIDLSEAAAKASDVRAAFERIKARNPSEVILVNNAAASGPTGLLHGLAVDQIESAVLANLVAPTILAREFVATFRDLRATKRIIHVSSGAAVKALPGSSVYCAAKAGLEMLARCCAAESEHARDGIEHVAFRPGTMDTRMQADMRSYSAEEVPIVELFRELHRKGMLRKPEVVAEAMIRGLIGSKVESGRIYSIDELLV